MPETYCALVKVTEEDAKSNKSAFLKFFKTHNTNDPLLERAFGFLLWDNERLSRTVCPVFTCSIADHGRPNRTKNSASAVAVIGAVCLPLSLQQPLISY